MPMTSVAQGRALSACGKAFGATLLLIAFACSGSDTKKPGLGATCQYGPECESGVCVNFYSGSYGYCSVRCGSECPQGMVCGTAQDGSKACMDACHTPDVGRSKAYGCRNGAPIACAVADESYCSDCGCPSDLRCEPKVGCQPKRDIDGPCAQDADCTSNNCSTYLGVCRIPVQSACTTANCDICTKDPQDGSTFCSRECDDTSQCNGGVCLVGQPTSCSRACSACGDPYLCKVTSNTLEFYCDCPRCIPESAPRPLNTACHYDNDCENGVCYSIGGFCTTTCSTDSDCSSTGMVCAIVPCTNGESKNCGSMCQRPCAADGTCTQYGATCRVLATPANASVSICDLHQNDGQGCGFDELCLSGRCVNQVCAPAP